MTNEQIILNEAAKLDPATLHAIATAHHTPEQIAAIAAKAITTDKDGHEKPASVADVEIILAAQQLHTIAKWNSLNKRIRTGEKSLITCYLWKYTTKPSKEQREAAEAEGKDAAPAPHFYPTKSYLFSCLQVQDAKAAPAARFGSTAEIMAYPEYLLKFSGCSKRPFRTRMERSSQYSEAPTFRGLFPYSFFQDGRLSFTASKCNSHSSQAFKATSSISPSRQVQRISPAPFACSIFASAIISQFGSPILG